MKVFLIGYMASGKSTLGKALAEALVLPFIDLDVEIERTAGTAISEIITAKGELHFRKLECGTQRSTPRARNGCIRTRRWDSSVLQSHGPVERRRGDHFLDVPVGELAKRLEGDIKRPLIQNKEDVAEFVAKHMFERRPYYSQAKHRIAGPSISVEELTAVLN